MAPPRLTGSPLPSLMSGIALLVALLAPNAGQARSAGQWHGPEEIFAKVCAYCHNKGIGPELRGRGLSPRSIVDTVRQGLNAMPAFRPAEISDAELDALAATIAQSAVPPNSTPSETVSGKTGPGKTGPGKTDGETR